MIPTAAQVPAAGEVVRVEVADRIAVVTLHRPEARNALSRQVLRELPAALRACDASDAVDAVVLTGADPAFCAGLDLKELGAGLLSGEVAPAPEAEADTAQQQADARPHRASPRRGPFPRMSIPVIGAVNGVAVTGGLEIALACDFLVASERARFADTHARIGVMPGWGLTVLLPQAVGLRRAREMSLTGNYVDAYTALAWGLVNHVVPHDDLVGAARSLAADIVGNDPAGVQRMLTTYREGTDQATAAQWELEGRVAASWHGDRAVDPDEVERRRRAVTERGRSQTAR